MAAHLHAVGIGREVGVQRPAVHARTADVHSCVVHEIRLVDHHECLAVPRLHRERRLDAVERAHGARRPQLLGAIESRPVGGNPPGARVVGHDELGQLVHDLEVGEAGLRGEFIAEGDAVVEGTDGYGELAVGRSSFGDRDLQLVVVIANARDLAPRLSPRCVKRAATRVHDAQAIAQRRGAAEVEAEHRRRQERVTVALDHVVELALMRLDQHDIAPVGRSHANLARRQRPGNQDRQQRRSQALHVDSPTMNGEHIFAELPGPSRG